MILAVPAPHRSAPWPRSVALLACAGLSLVEVVIAVFILTIVATSVVEGIVNLNAAQQAAKDRAQAMQLARTLAERVLSGTWDSLGTNVASTTLSNQNAWSWNRREYPSMTTAAGSSPHSLPPMDEVSADPLNRIDQLPIPPAGTVANPVSPALTPKKTGLNGVKIYLEYYHQDLIENMNKTGVNPRAVWDAAIKAVPSPLAYDDTTTFTSPIWNNGMDLRNESNAIMVRVLVTWYTRGIKSGRPQRYEMSFVRRK